MKACNFIKKRIQHKCFPLNITKVLGQLFYRITPLVAFELSFSIRKELKKSGEIAFAISSFFHVQIQELHSRLTATRAFVFLAKFAEIYYHKIFETRS